MQVGGTDKRVGRLYNLAMNSVLCFGGSFNPIHHGHLICARAAAEALGFARVRLIPSAQPPHKPQATDLAPAAARLQMCHLAVENDPLFEVDDVELRRRGPSYTIQTVREFLQRGEDGVHWLIGADMLAILPQWYQAEALMSLAQLHVLARPGWEFDFDSLPQSMRCLRQWVIPAPLVQISASEIRRRVASGQGIRYLLPAAVEAYVRQTGIYG